MIINRLKQEVYDTVKTTSMGSGIQLAFFERLKVDEDVMALSRYHDAKTNQTESSIKGYADSKKIHVKLHFL